MIVSCFLFPLPATTDNHSYLQTYHNCGQNPIRNRFDCSYVGSVFLNHGHWFVQNVFSSSAKILAFPAHSLKHFSQENRGLTKTHKSLGREDKKQNCHPRLDSLKFLPREPRTHQSLHILGRGHKNRGGPLVFFSFLTLAQCFVVFGANGIFWIFHLFPFPAAGHHR